MSDDYTPPARLQPDMPWNLPEEWEVPKFAPGEMPALLKTLGVNRISSERAWIKAGIRTVPLIENVKIGIACWRLGYLFETHRDGFAAVIRAASAKD